AGEWIAVPPVPGAYVINLGDMMELLTNGEFIATSHRVRRVQQERYSFPLFFAFDYETRVAPLSRFVSAERPARPTLVAGEHLFAQTAQSFRYLQERMARGEIRLPSGAVPLSSFGQEARPRNWLIREKQAAGRGPSCRLQQHRMDLLRRLRDCATRQNDEPVHVVPPLARRGRPHE